MLFVVEDGHQVVCGASSSVVADVYYQSFLAEAGGGEFAFDHFEAREVHAADVDISQFAAGPFFDKLFALIDPFFVEFVSQAGAEADGDLSCFSVGALYVQKDFFVDESVEQIVKIVVGLYGLAVDGGDDVACLQLACFFIGGGVGDNAVDLHACRGWGQFGADEAGGFFLCLYAIGSCKADVAGIDLAEQQVEHVAEVDAGAGVYAAIAVFCPELIPVVAVEFWVIVAIAHGAPGFFEDLFAFLYIVDL